MKQYTIKDAAKIMHVPTSTIRYYDKEGLLPFMQRLDSGYRIFSENDLGMLRTIDCLKNTGMPIREIRRYIDLTQQGDATLAERYQMFLERKKDVEAQIRELQATLAIVNFKCQYYQQALADGSEKSVKNRIQKELENCGDSLSAKSIKTP